MTTITRTVAVLAFAGMVGACAPLPPASDSAAPPAPPSSASPSPTAAPPSSSPSPTAPPPSASPSSAAAPAQPPASSAAQPPAAAASGAAGPAAIADFTWLRGCWHGTVNQRDFREQWLPLAGAMMVGIGHTVMQGRTQDYGYLRIEARADDVYYVAAPSGQKAATFRLAGVARDAASGADVYTFDNVDDTFPQHIVYHRGAEGWLYAGIDGKLDGVERKVIYPMRHVDCETDALLKE